MNTILGKSNPTVWDLVGFLYSGETMASWTMAKTAKPGDMFFIGLSGPQAGIYAVAKILNSPQLLPGCDDEFTKEPGWFDKPRWRSDIRIIKSFVDTPISDSILANSPELLRISDWLHNQGTHTILSEIEANQLSRLAKIK